MEANVKPGTRCGCVEAECGQTNIGHDAYGSEPHKCANEAVRMVLVPKKDQSLAYHGEIAVERVPMCEACAEYHQARQKAGA